MPDRISAGEHALNAVFSDEFLYVVPSYQRPYSWEREHAQELFDDVWGVASTATNVKDVDQLPPYFLGCLVVVKPEGKSESELVDGQQRLTTLTMLLCALRDANAVEDAKFSANAHAFVWQEGNELKGTEDVARLAIRDRDRCFFRTYVQEEGGLLNRPPNQDRPQNQGGLTDTERRIHENAELLFKEVKRLGLNERKTLGAYLLQKCFLVIVETTERSAATRIFNVLNTRGLDLSTTDILKAEITQDDDGSISERWEEVEDRLGRDSFNLLFSHIHTIKTHTRSRQALEDVFIRRVVDQLEGDFVGSVLEPYGDIYESLRNSYKSGSAPLDATLRSIRLVDHTDWEPVAIRFVETQRMELAASTDFMKELERLAYWMFVTRKHRDARVNRYISVLRTIDKGEELFADSSPLQLASSEKAEMLA